MLLQRAGRLARVVRPARPARTALAPASRLLSAKVPITFVDTDGHEYAVDAEPGRTLLEVAHENDIELEGACDGSLACSTCHLILDTQSFEKLPPPDEEELDMLDLAFDLQETCARSARGRAAPGPRPRPVSPSPGAAPHAPAATPRDAVRRSRLGCQVKAAPELSGMRCQLPEGSNNMMPPS